ncbi:hypothetical protein ATANTOWER_022705 [Ataeniobius toweri]|uniref:Uncharacterized protein n=1 Tax=Ataeniobius toweri TaxID=208326 RepID=A0ABU7A7R3_9TELE|nr:hypothetical protein [Ataeniobius toweri]
MLLRLPDQTGSVGTPGKVIGYVHTQVPEAGDHVHSCSSDVQERESVLVPSEIHHHLLSVLYVDAEVVFSAPLDQVFHLLSVFGLIIIPLLLCRLRTSLYDSWDVSPSSLTSAE